MKTFKNNLLNIIKAAKSTYFAVLFFCIILIVFILYKSGVIIDLQPRYTLGFLILGLILILILWVLVVVNTGTSHFSFINSGKRKISKLRKRIIIAFITGAAVPTLLVAIFSTYLFNFGIDAWFDKKVSKVLDQSISVGNSYIEEHVLQLKETSISVSEDFSAMYYNLVRNPALFNKLINAQAKMRSFDEAIIFQRDSNVVLAQTELSFSLSFINIPAKLIDRADKGEVVQIKSDPLKIRILIKLKGFNDTYLLIGRLVDKKIIDHIDKTNGAAAEYNKLKQKMMYMQIEFSMVFILLILCLLIIATIWGRNFAERIVKPIRHLVIAAEQVKNGDLTVQVPLKNMHKDEVKVLSSAFNRMVTQLDKQQKDLVVAQRSLAWSDVARRVAHEIKNPLTPIQLSAERLDKKFLNQVEDKDLFKKYIKNILNNSNDIRSIVSEFVDFARLPAPDITDCEIISFINDLIESRKVINNNINYFLQTNKKHFKFKCDIAQINRVFVNLIQNSEESLQESGNAIKKIKMKVLIKQHEFVVIISDNGKGFDGKALKLAKEAYFTTKSYGTGLGLSIVDRIVLDHRGTMEIDNNLDSGANIKLTFSL